MTTSAPALGWYGKLPSLGDFASRRLPTGFVEAWDAWLAAGLAQWQAQAPDAWLQDYLNGPSLRFLLMPGTLPGQAGAWCGVLMPSVDRVGRYFPLTLAQPLAALPTDAGALQALLGWLRRLDDLALDALEEDWLPDRLDDELAHLGDWRADAPPLPTWPLPDALPALLTARDDRTLWFCLDTQGHDVLRWHDGLPPAAALPGLLSTPPSPPTDETPHEH